MNPKHFPESSSTVSSANRRRWRFTKQVIFQGVLLFVLLSHRLCAANPPAGQVASWGSIMLPYVKPGTVFTKIAAGFDHGLAVTTTGTVVGWGANNLGQESVPLGLGKVLGIGVGRACSIALKSDGTVTGWGDPGSPETSVPASLKNVAAIAAGGDHGLALKRDGTVAAWGDDSVGQTDVPFGLTNVISISAGWDHGAALRRDGTMIAWGDDSSGQTDLPAGLSNVLEIACGSWFTLALKRDGTVAAWGDDSYGQLELPASLTNVVAIAAGYAHCLALRRDGSLVGWGDNSVGELNFPNGLINIVAIAAGGTISDFTDGIEAFNVALKRDGTLIGWGDNTAAESIAPGSLTNVVSVASTWSSFGDGDVLALRSDGTLIGWGNNPYGQYPAPTGLSNIVTVAAGGEHSLALKADGTVVGWGDDSYGQLDPPPDASNIVAIAAAALSSMALRNDGVAFVWGYEYSGMSFVGPLSNVVAISACESHSITLMSGGNVVEWGSLAGSSGAVEPAGLSNVVAVATGAGYSLGLKSDGTVTGWGDNFYGQSLPPAGLSNVVAIAAAGSHSLALKTDGTVVVWGDDSNGQLDLPAGLSNVLAVAAGGGINGDDWSLGLESATAQFSPKSVAGQTFLFTVRDGIHRFDNSGSFSLKTANAGNGFTLTAGGQALEFGTYAYTKTSANIAQIKLNSPQFGLTTAYLSFSDKIEGSFFMDQPTSGGFQAGRFALTSGTAPAITITSPGAGASVTNSSIFIQGTGRDSVEVSRVEYRLENASGISEYHAAIGTTIWSGVVSNLAPGTNTVRARSRDAAGNVSAEITSSFVFVVMSPLTIVLRGHGTLAPNYADTLLQIGKVYRVTATPAAGFAFSNWTDGLGNVLTNKPALTFHMQSNLAFYVNFMDVVRPVNVILTPKANQTVTNGTLTATGKATDNVGVSNVWYQFNNGLWTSAGLNGNRTNWSTPALTPFVGSNTISAFAMDRTGNVSLTNKIRFKFTAWPTADWAPDSLNGVSALMTASDGSFKTVTFDPVTFAQWEGNPQFPNTNSNDFGVGNYTYIKTDTNTAQLSLSFTAPRNDTNNARSVDLVFTNRYDGYFTNTISGEVGRFMVILAVSSTSTVPESLTGKTITVIDESSSHTNTIKLIGGATFTKTPVNNGGSGSSAGNYTFTRFSPVCAMLTLTFTNVMNFGEVTYFQADFNPNSTGDFFATSFDSGGNVQDTGSGTFRIH